MKQYKYIRAWGRYMGSYQYYIDEQVYKAQQDGAPENAIYLSGTTGEWVTFDEVTSDHAKSSINFILQQMGETTNE